MVREMKWHCPTPQGNKELYIRVGDVNNGAWGHYKSFTHLCVPDYEIPGGSKGWATFQKLLKSGFSLVKSDD